MNPEPASLLDDLTGPRGDSAGFLVRALHARRQRRTQIRAAALSVLSVAALGLVAALLAPGPSPSPLAVTPPREPFKLTDSELLDSFSDQPVAMVTWPDGRKQLLAIAHPAPARR